MKTKLLLLSLFLILISCSRNNESPIEEDEVTPKANKVLMLKVDLNTKTFEGGKEFTFDTQSETFTITNDYKSPNDFGYLKLTYKEINQPLFDGGIVWMGLGEMNYPTNLLSASQFEKVIEQNVISPKNGFENIFNPSNTDLNISAAWLSIQNLKIVREYLKSNPDQKVKFFLYTPSVGVGDPAEWDYIFYLKN